MLLRSWRAAAAIFLLPWLVGSLMSASTAILALHLARGKAILCGQGWVLSQLADDPRFSAFLVGMRYLSEPFDWPDALVLLPAGLVRRRGCKLKLPTCLQMFACGDVT